MSALFFLLLLAVWCFGCYRVYAWVMKDVPKGARVSRSAWAYPSKDDVAESRRALEERRQNRAGRQGAPYTASRDPLIEPSPTLPGLPQGQTVQDYAGEGMVDLRIFMVQQARKRGTTHRPEVA